MIEIENLSVSYGDTLAVDDVSVSVGEGETLALLGPSGCGKSSLLRAVAGLVASSGTIRIDGRDMSGVDVAKRGVGVVFQDGQLFPTRTVAGNIRYGISTLDRTAQQERVEELLRIVGMESMGDRAVTTLSGGQAQRVALARSLAPEPAVLLLDEPLSALDRELRERLAIDLERILGQTSTTAIYVTHDQDEAFTVADRIAVMFEGRIAALGTLDELAGSTDPKVADFLDLDTLVPASQVDVPGGGYVRLRRVGAGTGPRQERR